MARLKNGIFGPLVGRLGNIVGYVRLGKALARMRPVKKKKRDQKRSPAQKAASNAFAVVSSFVTPINEFINVGFKLDIIGTGRIPRNAAMSYNSVAVTGEYPDQKFDYTKGVVSAGKLLVPTNPRAELHEYNPVTRCASLKFSWDVNPNWESVRKRDQVMLLVYFPESRDISYTLSGARRVEGSDILPLSVEFRTGRSTVRETYAETYMAFISDNRESISNSVYTGRIILTS